MPGAADNRLMESIVIATRESRLALWQATHVQGLLKERLALDAALLGMTTRGDQIVAVPTLVRHLPPPMKKIIGDLSNADRVLVGLDLRPDSARKRARP